MTMRGLAIVGALLFVLSMQIFPVECKRIVKAEAFIGVDEVKSYLTRYGYLIPGSKLESGLTMFQKINHLNITGNLSFETVDLINTPRCGMADHNLIRGVETVVASRAHTWPSSKMHLTYKFIPGAPSNVGTFDLVQACFQAFNMWANVSKFTFKLVGPTSPSDLTISFQRGDHGDGDPFDGLGGQIAHAFLPTDGRLHFDADEIWSFLPTHQYYELDLVLSAMHEIGHLLGLPHSSNRNAIMYAFYKPGLPRALTLDDIAAIRALYP